MAAILDFKMAHCLDFKMAACKIVNLKPGASGGDTPWHSRPGGVWDPLPCPTRGLGRVWAPSLTPPLPTREQGWGETPSTTPQGAWLRVAPLSLPKWGPGEKAEASSLQRGVPGEGMVPFAHPAWCPWRALTPFPYPT